ncbi:CDK-activating kinase assembly factor MAT1-domain-containing protein [Dactylonectria estremocensis]|uniref:RNA polymerase II transcription factor B subunit 3 n=1 Tax=Dactylonectria estremocensis TaxID=1079267 RepID=A0A9P9F6Y6_9HYPO|nr:CDK-activating kinase assembly factor MAT1-domain-containing protein [Dactylonectria estremocensis]
MSRLGGSAISVRHSSGGMVASSSGAGASSAPVPLDQDETCPVCKTTRYFNRDMEFRINPECYHRMCKTCVERIFKDGPNQCPYAGCHKTLRLRGFKSAFFADLRVEREVDIRRRVAAVFNKVEEDFETLDSFNDYLFMVECLTDDLVNGGDEARGKAEAQLLEWEAQHKADIERNRRLARESDETRRSRVAAEQDAQRQRRQMERQAEADEKANAVRFREKMLDTMRDAEMGRATEAMDRVMLKKRGQLKRDAAVDATTAAAGGLSIRGLREKKVAVVDDKPYDPYGGVVVAPDRIDVAPEKLAGYTNEWVESARTKTEYRAGGYNPDEYLTRVLFEAFSGLGVFICDEQTEKGVPTATAAGGNMDVDDPF